MSKSDQARTLLRAIRDELQAQRLWEAAPPSPEALASSAPFCFDTLQFNQWLQWVFLPRTHALLDAGGEFPSACHIAPMAEWFSENEGLKAQGLIDLVQRFDALWNDRPGSLPGR